MNKDEFLQSIIGDSDSKDEVLFSVLLARGFFVSKENNNLQLSDNSHEYDACALDSFLRTNGIGYVEASRVVVTSYEALDKLDLLFDRSNNSEAFTMFEKWSQFRRHK